MAINIIEGRPLRDHSPLLPYQVGQSQEAKCLFSAKDSGPHSNQDALPCTLSLSLFFFFFFCVNGVLIKSLHLKGRHSTT
jgi:hypothetical protein